MRKKIKNKINSECEERWKPQPADFPWIRNKEEFQKMYRCTPSDSDFQDLLKGLTKAKKHE